jgi:hypothetical protein
VFEKLSETFKEDLNHAYIGLPEKAIRRQVQGKEKK